VFSWACIGDSGDHTEIMTDAMKTPPLRKFDLHTHYYPVYFDRFAICLPEFVF